MKYLPLVWPSVMLGWKGNHLAAAGLVAACCIMRRRDADRAQPTISNKYFRSAPLTAGAGKTFLGVEMEDSKAEPVSRSPEMVFFLLSPQKSSHTE